MGLLQLFQKYNYQFAKHRKSLIFQAFSHYQLCTLVNRTTLSTWDELIQLMYLRILTKGSYVEICRLFRTFVGTYPLIVPFTKKALLLGVPSIIKIGVINSLFSLPESSFRFDTLDFRCQDSRSTKFLDLQLTELYTTITASCFHFKYF